MTITINDDVRGRTGFVEASKEVNKILLKAKLGGLCSNTRRFTRRKENNLEIASEHL